MRYLFAFIVLCYLSPLTSSAQKVLAGVVRIETTDIFDQAAETGAGMLINKSGRVHYVITAYHVVRDAKTVRVQFYNEGGKTYPVKITNIEASPELDLALLRLERPPANIAPFRMVDPFSLKTGRPVTMVGHPRGGKNWEVNKRNQIKDLKFAPAKIAITNLGVAGGFSGGPLLSRKKDRLIGMINERNSVQVISTDIEDIYVQLQDWGISPDLLLEPRRSLHPLTFPLLGASSGAIALGVINRNDISDKYAIYREHRDATAPIYEEIGIPREELLDHLKNKKTLLIGGYTLAGVAAAAAVWLNVKKRRLTGSQARIELKPFFPYGADPVVGVALGVKVPF